MAILSHPGKLQKGKGEGGVRTRFRNLAPVVDTFRPFCVGLTPESRHLLLGIRQTGHLAGGVAVLTIRAYVRISTADQRCELQVRELREHHRTDSGEAFRDVEELIMAIEG